MSSQSISHCGERQHAHPCAEDPGKGNGCGLEVSNPSEEAEEDPWVGTWEAQNLKPQTDTFKPFKSHFD